jgi:hypothetical protein
MLYIDWALLENYCPLWVLIKTNVSLYLHSWYYFWICIHENILRNSLHTRYLLGIYFLITLYSWFQASIIMNRMVRSRAAYLCVRKTLYFCFYELCNKKMAYRCYFLLIQLYFRQMFFLLCMIKLWVVLFIGASSTLAGLCSLRCKDSLSYGCGHKTGRHLDQFDLRWVGVLQTRLITLDTLEQIIAFWKVYDSTYI